MADNIWDRDPSNLDRSDKKTDCNQDIKITIIGGTRGLGNWIANFLKKRGCNITITGRNSIVGTSLSNKMGVSYTSNNVEAVSKADVVILAVPIETTPQIIREIGPHLKEGSLLTDVTSVKEEPAALMYQFVRPGVEVLPTHPMFGPRVRSLEGQVVVLTPSQSGDWYERVVQFLENEQVRILVTSPDIHDRMMSIVQGLTHLAYISIAAAIERLGIEVKDSRKFASPIYSLMLDIIARIVAQNPYLCYSLQTHNRYVAEVHQIFLETYQELKSMIDQGNQEDFVKAMSSAAKHLDDLESALGRSDKAISGLNSEIKVIKNSFGQEIGLRHMYSGKIHLGVIKELSPDFLTLKENNKEIRLKLSNIEVLSPDELIEWKIHNFSMKTYDVSVIFPEFSEPDLIAQTIETLEDVVECKVLDVYKGEQIPVSMKSITLRYKTINLEGKLKVENLLVGFGGQIR
jgi:prephenate dehydrogenase